MFYILCACVVCCVQLFVTPWFLGPCDFQARILEWVALPFSRGSSQAGDQSPALAGDFFNTEPSENPFIYFTLYQYFSF